MTLQIESGLNNSQERRFGRLDRYYIRDFTESSHPHLVDEAKKVHGEGYVNEGFVVQDALNAEGHLPDSIDKARGPNVHYYLSTGWDVDSDNTLTTEKATMRKIGIPEGQGISALPAYQLCADNLEPQYREYLESIDQPSATVKEIAALARTRDASPMAVFELLRDALQDSREREEVWFFSIVSTTHKSLVDNFGPNAIKQIGTPVSFDDDRIGKGVELVPALVHTDLFLDEIRRTIVNTDDPRMQNRLTRSFMFFTEGLPDDSLSAESVDFREMVKDMLRAKSSRT